jgi:hypothetical protein
MLVLFDQGTPIGIRDSLPGHTVRTAAQQGWSTLLNGQLLRAAEHAGFDVLLTTDTNLQFQQNLEGRKLAVVILNRNKWIEQEQVEAYSPRASSNSCGSPCRKARKLDSCRNTGFLGTLKKRRI